MVIVPKPRLFMIIGRYSMRLIDSCQEVSLRKVPKWVVFQNWSFKIIDSFCISSRIPPNMYYPFALPRTRRPKPTSFEKVGSFLFG